MYRFTGNVIHELEGTADNARLHRMTWTSFTTNRDQ